MSSEQRGQLLQQTGPDFARGSSYCLFSPNIVWLMITPCPMLRRATGPLTRLELPTLETAKIYDVVISKMKKN
eukprot:CAMPEP_0184709866 /NCGR_PEP_ID=MMETSP0314-20130426/891_1 /TAXON_ID=38298 /ORGANISM="Rhodella maculata, Strain CCMP 736" /LENGTH=72 /DNA_ID=CAMNT_0027171627 /DNA_START=21 /DNA_END=236 /DNA_ORIENTATION=+